MKIKTIKAYKYNYNYKYWRKYKEIEGIVIHNTASSGHDTAENNGIYFKKNYVGASANFFIDQYGYIVKSVLMHRIAHAVETPGLKLLTKYNNKNTVSIELCDIMTQGPSEAQIESLKWLIKRIRKKIGRDIPIMRHYDINHKECPKRYIKNDEWEKFRKEIEA